MGASETGMPEGTAAESSERKLATQLFNDTWALLEMESRSPEDDDRMIHMAHASRFHWDNVGDDQNRAIGEWQVARVYSVLGHGESALFHARRCLDYASRPGHPTGCWPALTRDSREPRQPPVTLSPPVTHGIQRSRCSARSWIPRTARWSRTTSTRFRSRDAAGGTQELMVASLVASTSWMARARSAAEGRLGRLLPSAGVGVDAFACLRAARKRCWAPCLVSP
jgi:hypothetical protein